MSFSFILQGGGELLLLLGAAGIGSFFLFNEINKQNKEMEDKADELDDAMDMIDDLKSK